MIQKLYVNTLAIIPFWLDLEGEWHCLQINDMYWYSVPVEEQINYVSIAIYEWRMNSFLYLVLMY